MAGRRPISLTQSQIVLQVLLSILDKPAPFFDIAQEIENSHSSVRHIIKKLEKEKAVIKSRYKNELWQYKTDVSWIQRKIIDYFESSLRQSLRHQHLNQIIPKDERDQLDKIKNLYFDKELEDLVYSFLHYLKTQKAQSMSTIETVTVWFPEYFNIFQEEVVRSSKNIGLMKHLFQIHTLSQIQLQKDFLLKKIQMRKWERDEIKQ